MFCFTILRL